MGVQIVTTAFAAEHHQRQIHFIRSTHETKIVKKATEMGGYRQRLLFSQLFYRQPQNKFDYLAWKQGG